MRRTVFESSDLAAYEELAQKVEVGYLGINDPDGYPRLVPLNFLLLDDCICFHGAIEGEKFEVLKQEPRVSFAIVQPYAIIPSYWITKGYACPATALYKSVYIRGVGHVVDNIEEKARVLRAFMEKYQPEGNYIPLTAGDPMYRKPLQEVAVFRIEAERVDLKFKFGQNFNEKKRRELMVLLNERNEGLDRLTAEEIRKTLKSAVGNRQ